MYCSTPGSLSVANSWSLPKLMSIESVMPSNHLILCLILHTQMNLKTQHGSCPRWDQFSTLLLPQEQSLNYPVISRKFAFSEAPAWVALNRALCPPITKQSAEPAHHRVVRKQRPLQVESTFPQAAAVSSLNFHP